MFDDLAYVIVYVNDMAKSTTFYRDVLGIPLDYAAPGWTQFKSRGAALVLHPKVAAHETPAGVGGQAAANGNATHLAFRVDDLDAAYRKLSAQSVKFLAPPATAGFGKHVTLFDPEGNAIDLIEWAKPHEARVVSDATIVNDILAKSPEAMEVFEEHGIRICGGCIVLLNASVRETAEYSGLLPTESSTLVEELNEKLNK